MDLDWSRGSCGSLALLSGVVTSPSVSGVVTSPSVSGVVTSPSVSGVVTSPSVSGVVRGLVIITTDFDYTLKQNVSLRSWFERFECE